MRATTYLVIAMAAGFGFGRWSAPTVADPLPESLEYGRGADDQLKADAGDTEALRRIVYFQSIHRGESKVQALRDAEAVVKYRQNKVAATEVSE